MAGSFTIDLAPRTALITGGSRGIGRATGELLARAGARVALNYLRDEAAVNAAVRDIRSAGGEAMALAGDVGDVSAARQLVRDVITAWGRLDILVLNAGIWEEDVAGRGDVDVWDRTYAVNLRGPFLVTDAAVSHLEEHGGSIVFVSSTAGQRGEARHSAYAASKGAIISYTKSLAAELGPRGIRVNAVAPGWVYTDMSRQALDNPITRADAEKVIPIGRVATPADIAGPILFLVSDLARHLQGEIMNVNGGSVLVG